MYFKLIHKLHKKHQPNNRKSFLSHNFVLQKILLVLGKVDYCRLILNQGCESTLTKLNKIWDQITRDPEWVEALREQKIVWDHHLIIKCWLILFNVSNSNFIHIYRPYIYIYIYMYIYYIYIYYIYIYYIYIYIIYMLRAKVKQQIHSKPNKPKEDSAGSSLY